MVKNENGPDRNLWPFKVFFVLVIFIAFFILAGVYTKILFSHIPWREFFLESTISFCIVLILCLGYTYRGLFHQIYNPTNKLRTNFYWGFVPGLFIGYFIMYYSYHYVHPPIGVPFAAFYTFGTFSYCLMLAIYTSLIICVILSILTTLSKHIDESSKSLIALIRYRKYSLLEILSFLIICISFIILSNEFIQIISTHKIGIYGLILSPCLFSLPVLVLSSIEYLKRKNSLAKIIFNIGILMLFWGWFIMSIGHLL